MRSRGESDSNIVSLNDPKKTSNTTLTIKKREFHATLFYCSTTIPEGHESCQASCQNSYVSEGWTEKEREKCDAECEGKIREEIKYTEKRTSNIYRYSEVFTRIRCQEGARKSWLGGGDQVKL